MSSVVRQVENLNKYVTLLERKVVTRIEVCEGDVGMANQQCLTLVDNYNDLAINLTNVIRQVHELRNEWKEWHEEEEDPQDQGEEEVFHDPEQSTLLVPSREQSSQQDQVYRSLIDLTPIQRQREVATPPTTGSRVAETPPRHYVEGFASSALTMAALKGSKRTYVQDQSEFRVVGSGLWA